MYVPVRKYTFTLQEREDDIEVSIWYYLFPSFYIVRYFNSDSLGSWERAMATHSSVLAWKIPGMMEPGELSSMGSHRVRQD